MTAIMNYLNIVKKEILEDLDAIENGEEEVTLLSSSKKKKSRSLLKKRKKEKLTLGLHHWLIFPRVKSNLPNLQKIFSANVAKKVKKIRRKITSPQIMQRV